MGSIDFARFFEPLFLELRKIYLVQFVREQFPIPLLYPLQKVREHIFVGADRPFRKLVSVSLTAAVLQVVLNEL